jgi:hypothetical protein
MPASNANANADLLIGPIFNRPHHRSVRLDRDIIGVVERREGNWWIVREKVNRSTAAGAAPRYATVDHGPYGSVLEAAGECLRRWNELGGSQ